jgi:hypothetical protein
MKQLIGRVASEVLWCLGDWVSRPMYYWDWAWIYPTYNWLMGASYSTQVWSGTTGPWKADTIEKENK